MGISSKEKARLAAAEIRAGLNPERILLFGSAARGTDTAASDIDLCLLFETLPARKLEVLRKARKLVRPVYKGAMDIVVYSREEWLAYLAIGASFESKLEKEAISL
ncbi:MAG TPA: nucleotidyltransferase domain-containing protein [Rectinemataceae bacterium]|nr:nucleotidyltransferase domain-containing protein [Rectinemataceae bacterium]